MTKAGVERLQQSLDEATKERDYYASLVCAFLTGEVPVRASLQHHIFAQWGRKRLRDTQPVPAILAPAEQEIKWAENNTPPAPPD